MNLIQIQEHLKDLPIQVIMSYANGQNPEVPPYMALGELNRRKTSEQRKAEPPTQSVKEKLESEVGGRGMPPGMPPGAPQAAPQGIAQLPAAQMPQGAPQEMPPPPQGTPPGAPLPPQGMPPGMAAGGVAGLPVRDDMFHYAPGGIVAFGGGGEADEETAGEAEARAGMAAADQSQGPPASAIQPSGLQSLIGPATDIIKRGLTGDMGVPEIIDPEAAKQEAIKRDPRLKDILSKIPGTEYLALVDKLKAQNDASKTQFQENQKRLNFGALGDALIAAGEATRGQQGIGAAFAGFGKSYSNYTAEDIKRQQAQKALERQQEIETVKLQSDADNLRMAYATGDVDKIAKYSKDVADRKAKIEGNRLVAAKEGISLGMEETKMKGTLAHYEATEKNQRLTLEEMIRNHADQASIERQRLRVQEAQNARTAAHQTVMEDIARSTKVTADDKANGLVLNRVERDGGYQNLAKSLLDKDNPVEIGSPQYYKILDSMNDIAVRYYKQYPNLKPPEYVGREPITATNPQTGEKQISYDGGRNWQSTGNVTRGTQPGGNINYVPGRR